MFIQTEETPNPNTLKFIPEDPLLEKGKVAFFTNPEDAHTSPLAEAIFALGMVKSVYIEEAFLSVTKLEDKSWDHIKAPVLQTIMEHYNKGLPTMVEESGQPKNKKSAKKLSEVEEKIVKLLEERVQPAVAQDGGRIDFHSFEKGVVYLEMKGACAGCPSSLYTLKGGIESLLQHYIPEVKSVHAIEMAT